MIQILSFDICWNIYFLWNTFQDDKPKEIAIYQTVCENMPDPNVLCRLVDLISTRISMSSDPVTVVSRWVDTHNTSTLQISTSNSVYSDPYTRESNFVWTFDEYATCI